MSRTPGSMRAPTIGQLSALTGCNIETIRYYERIGLLPPAERSAAGQRLYTQADVRRVNFIRRSRALGFGIERIRKLLLLDSGEIADRAAARSVAEAHLREVRAKLTELVEIERVLGGLVAQCRPGENPGCPVLEALDKG